MVALAFLKLYLGSLRRQKIRELLHNAELINFWANYFKKRGENRTQTLWNVRNFQTNLIVILNGEIKMNRQAQVSIHFYRATLLCPSSAVWMDQNSQFYTTYDPCYIKSHNMFNLIYVKHFFSVPLI